MSNIFIDIETLPTDNPVAIERVKAKLSAPSNYKDPEKIAAYIENEAESAVGKTGLSGLFGRVLCICYAFDDENVQTLYLDDFNNNERLMLAQFRMACTSGLANEQRHCFHRLIGHNALGFDVPFLSQRMMVNGLKPLFRHGVKPWDMPVDDTMLMFACGSKNYASLDDLCLAFGIESPKTGLDGSQIAQAYADGRHDEIKKYCAGDVIATRQVYYKLTNKEAA